MDIPKTPTIHELEERLAALEARAGREALMAPRRGRRRVGVVVAMALVLAAAPGLVLAGISFDDVPPANIFHDDIAAIAHAGVTTGCGPSIFCPDDYVTREQMAAFLNRLGALGPGKQPVVDALELEGRRANHFVRLASETTSVASAVLTNVEVTYLDIEIDAPTHGYVLVNVALTGREQACTVSCTMQGRIRHLGVGAHSPIVTAWIHERTSLAMTYRFAVAPGTNTFETRINRPAAGDGNMNGWYNQMTALFVPFNGQGTPPN